ncbi:type II toxin-antitoxin system prevent-host-death family antitoxin [Streptomyces sp. E11-3]|uniref:type II toxin-antitoxin system Phd/YefM family antitoxin n=1 Tax=Streptomyces sp. E11-3 TaxID=3110112 RepID=UPI00398133D4
MSGETETPGIAVVPLRDLNQPSRIAERVEAGTTLIVTKNGQPIMRIEAIGRQHAPAWPFRTDPMGPVDLPDLDLPTLTDEEISGTLRGMGGGLDS